jgi:hypothetical protein
MPILTRNRGHAVPRAKRFCIGLDTLFERNVGREGGAANASGTMRAAAASFTACGVIFAVEIRKKFD